MGPNVVLHKTCSVLLCILQQPRAEKSSAEPVVAHWSTWSNCLKAGPGSTWTLTYLVFTLKILFNRMENRKWSTYVVLRHGKHPECVLIFCVSWWLYDHQWPENGIGGVMVSVLSSSAADRGFEPLTKYYKLSFFASTISTQH
jgi:hypothetical protein